MNYDSNCPICVHFVNEKNRDEKSIIYESGDFLVTPNPRWSPHAYRTAIVPKRHIGKEGMYGMNSLNDKETFEFKMLRGSVTDAIIEVVNNSNLRLKKREGCPLIDYLERPSVHPSADLFPTFDGSYSVYGFQFPKYEPAQIYSGSTDIKEANVILASFPKSKADLNMPKALVRKIAEDIKDKMKI